MSVRLWMYTIRPITLVLIMMLSGIYIDAFSSEAASKRENFPSVADDLVDLVGDIFNHNDMQVGRFPAPPVSYVSFPRHVPVSLRSAIEHLLVALFFVHSLSSKGLMKWRSDFIKRG